MKNKKLVLFSSGIDSTVCLAIAVSKYGSKNVIALCIDYGQNNYIEIKKAKKIAEEYNVYFEVIDLKNIFKYSNSSMIKKSNKDIPYESYDDQYKKLKEGQLVSTNVPFRNGVMLSVAASYALEKNVDEIYYGIHREEGIARSLYPDCSEGFDMAMNLAIYIGTGQKIKINAPLAALSKKDIIKLGIDLKVPFEDTWTCYESDLKPCGKCTACVDRIKAFKENNLVDPLCYKEV